MARELSENEISRVVVDAALKVHRHFGPGIFEVIYEVTLAHELRARGLTVRRQVPVAVEYAGIHFDEGFRADVLVADKVVLELKSVEELHPRHFKQLLTYLRLMDRRLGLLINFNEKLLKDGIHRIVNNLPE